MSLGKKLLLFVVLMIVVIVSIMTYKNIKIQKDIYEDALNQQIYLLQKNLISEAKSRINKLKDDIEDDLSSFNLSHINKELIQLVEDENIIGVVLFSNNATAQYSVGDITEIQKQQIDTLNIENLSDKIILSVPIIITNTWGSLSVVYSKNILNDTLKQEKNFIKNKIQNSLVNSLFTSFYIAVFFLMIAYIFAKKLISPVVLLTDIAKNITSDNLDEVNKKFKNINTNDEVGMLSKAFYDMIIRVKNSYRELQELNNSLELKVLKRTKELATAKLKAEESTKLKSEFLANVSHEIRTPINGITGMTYLLKESNLNKQQNTYLRTIDNSAKNLLRIINDILDFSKIEAGMVTIENIRFRLRDIIDSAVDLVFFKAEEKGIKLHIHVDERIHEYYEGDTLRLSQVLLNLLSNAIKFTDIGEVSLKIIKIDEHKLRFIVEDTGIGLDENEKKKLFKSFSQADGSISRKYGGTGLGLSISKKLVELMGGTIWIESEKEAGSKFIFEIILEESENLQIDTQAGIKLEIDTKEKEKLFEKLLEAIKTFRPKNCENVMNELEIYKFNDIDEALLQKIKTLIRMYKFKEAQELMENK